MSGQPLSVLHISRSDNLGGSARSAYKIHDGLRALGLTSRMMVQMRGANDPDVDVIHGGRLSLRALDRVGSSVIDPLGLQYLYYPSSFALLDHPWLKSANVVQLYNTHGGYFTHRVLPRLSQRRVVVWRLSDMWPLTGHCAYSHGCERWQTGCGKCPILDEYPPLRWDSTALLWRIKDRIYARSRLVVVATNRWMEDIVRRSPLLGRFPVHTIPNGVDTEVFRPIPQLAARQALGIPPNRKVVLFAAHVAAAGTRKGGQFVNPAMQKLVADGMKNLVLLVAGDRADAWPEQAGVETIRLGYVASDRLLAAVYSAADVLIYPAVAENFPNSIIESMACGTPVVAFDTGGIRDALRDGDAGYLAAPGDAGDLARGLKAVLQDASARARMSRACRKAVEQDYSTDIQARRYADLYQSLCHSDR